MASETSHDRTIHNWLADRTGMVGTSQVNQHRLYERFLQDHPDVRGVIPLEQFILTVLRLRPGICGTKTDEGEPIIRGLGLRPPKAR